MAEVMGVLRRKSGPAADGKDRGGGGEQELKNREDGDTGQLSGSWGVAAPFSSLSIE